MASDLKKAAGAVAAGGVVGAGTIAVTRATAVGILGGGAGIGAPAGPVGIVAGAVVGLAAYGAMKAIGEDRVAQAGRGVASLARRKIRGRRDATAFMRTQPKDSAP